MGYSAELKSALAKVQEKRIRQMARLREQGKTYTEIAATFGISRQRVYQILRAAGEANTAA